MKNDFTSKKVAVLGYGVNNAELVPFLQKRGAIVTVCDKNESLPSPPPNVALRLGQDYLKNLTDFDVVFRTPGLPYLTPEIQDAKRTGVHITSQTQLFLEECQAKTIGVTGTKGKGTTASLIANTITAASDRGTFNGTMYLAGNIGASALGLLEKANKNDWVILELSSFQLQDMTVSPHIAVVLNITSDHLDYHQSVEEYHEAKKNLLQHQTPDDFAVLFRDSELTVAFQEGTPAAIYYFSRLQPVERGAFVEGENIILRLKNFEDHQICSIKDIQLIGSYNLENVTAAIAASAVAGIDTESIRQGVTSFGGLHHRLERVAEKYSITFYDDSKSTTPDSTIAAVESFMQPVTLILGGSPKGADYTPLIDALDGSHVITVICIGQEGERIKNLLEEAHASQKILTGSTTMDEIVRQALKATQPGGIILLSPAAASFGMFKNAEDRGDQFQSAVKAL